MAVLGGPRSPNNSRATRLLLARMTGASTMPSTTVTSSGCAMAGSMASFCNSSVSSAMPNSPPTASVTPVRTALKLESTNRRVANEAITALMSTIEISNARITQISRHRAPKSSSMPTEMKNRPSRMSRNGRMTLSTWWLYSVSASIMPARNAPSAIDRPAICEAQADASATSSTASVNSSRSRLLAIT